MYAQPTSPNNVSRLTSTLTTNLKKKCVVFYYNMFGSGSNKLNVYLIENNDSAVVWSDSQNQGNKVNFNSKIIFISKIIFYIDLLVDKSLYID